MKTSVKQAELCAAAMAQCKQAEANSKELAAAKAATVPTYITESGRVKINPEAQAEHDLIETTRAKVQGLNTYDEAFNLYFQNKEALIVQQKELTATPETADDYKVKYWAVMVLLIEALELSARITSGTLQGTF